VEDQPIVIQNVIKKLKAVDDDKAHKKARREKMEAERLGRLDRLRQMTASMTRTSPRWMMASAGRWTWFEYNAETGTLVDTGIEPVPGVPLPQQRPEGR
jgi:hypothetical protein